MMRLMGPYSPGVQTVGMPESDNFLSFLPIGNLRYLIVPAWLDQHTNPNKVTQKCPRSTFL